MYNHDAQKIIRMNFNNLDGLNSFLDEKHYYSDDSWDVIQTNESCRGLQVTFRFQKNGKLS